MEIGKCLCLVWLVSLYDVHNSKIGTRKIPRKEEKTIEGEHPKAVCGSRLLLEAVGAVSTPSKIYYLYIEGYNLLRCDTV
jgi:hypothetical protein